MGVRRYVLQSAFNGEELLLILAFTNALLRARQVVHQGITFFSQVALKNHLVALVEHPWLQCSRLLRSRSERRQARARPPPEVPAHVILYRSDGAPRGQRAAENSEASFAAIRFDNGQPVAWDARSLGDVSNNIAEYNGLLACLIDAHSRRLMSVLVQVDSMLVAMQASGVWRCQSSNLQDAYALVLSILRRMRRNGAEVTIEHIYREFNTVADGMANQVLNQRVDQITYDWRYF